MYLSSNWNPTNVSVTTYDTICAITQYVAQIVALALLIKMHLDFGAQKHWILDIWTYIIDIRPNFSTVAPTLAHL